MSADVTTAAKTDETTDKTDAKTGAIAAGESGSDSSKQPGGGVALGFKSAWKLWRDRYRDEVPVRGRDVCWLIRAKSTETTLGP